MSEQAKHYLMAYDWPGNVRQLENMIRNTVVMNSKPWIEADMFPTFPQSNKSSGIIQPAFSNQSSNQTSIQSSIQHLSNKTSHINLQNNKTDTFQSSDIEPLWVIEKRYIEEAISACNDNVPKAAALLDVSPSTIYRKMKSWEQIKQQA
jgi:two-component system repressor protein LuxO